MKKKIEQISLSVFIICCTMISTVIAQEYPTTWQEQLQFVKNKYTEAKAQNNGNGLSLINYTYKGIIASESVKSAVLDSLISPNTLFPIHLASVFITDTTCTENSFSVTKKEYPIFLITTLDKLEDISKLLGTSTSLKQLRQELDELIPIGFGYLEIEWDYNGKKFASTAIISNDGGIVYEHMKSRVTEDAIVKWNIP